MSMAGLPGQATPPWNMATWGRKRKKRERDVTGTHQHSNSHRSAGLAQVPGSLQSTTPHEVSDTGAADFVGSEKQSDLAELAQPASRFGSGSGSQFSVPAFPELHWPGKSEGPRGAGECGLET